MKTLVAKRVDSRFFSSVVGIPLCAILLFALFFLAASTGLADDAAAEAVRHSFLGVSKDNKAVIVAEDGSVEWTFDMPASDGWVLRNGNLLLAIYGTKGFPNGGVVEVEPKSKAIVFQNKGQQRETSTVQPLPDGTFLVAELGPQPRAVVIDRNGEVVKATPLQCQKENVHMQTRMLRVLPNGNTVISSYHTKGKQVKLFEVKREKKVVRRYSGMEQKFHHFQIVTTNGKPRAGRHVGVDHNSGVAALFCRPPNVMLAPASVGATAIGGFAPTVGLT